MLGERHLLREMRQVDFQSIEWRKLRALAGPSTEVFVFMRDPGANTNRCTQTRATHTDWAEWGISSGPERQFIWNKHAHNTQANAAVFHSNLFTYSQLNCEGGPRRHLAKIKCLLEKMGGIRAPHFPWCSFFFIPDLNEAALQDELFLKTLPKTA